MNNRQLSTLEKICRAAMNSPIGSLVLLALLMWLFLQLLESIFTIIAP